MIGHLGFFLWKYYKQKICVVRWYGKS